MGKTICLLGKDYLDISLTEPIPAGFSNTVTVTAKDGHGNTVTAYSSCTATLKLIPESGSEIDVGSVTLASGVGSAAFTFSDVPPGTYTLTATLNMTDGSATGRANRLYIPVGWNTVSVAGAVLVFTASPSGTISRDANFTVTIQAQDGSGNKIAAANDLVTITLTSDDGSDKLKSSNATTRQVQLVNGEWTTSTEQITGGTGADNTAHLTASATGFSSVDSDTFHVATYNLDSAYHVTVSGVANSTAEYPPYGPQTYTHSGCNGSNWDVTEEDPITSASEANPTGVTSWVEHFHGNATTDWHEGIGTSGASIGLSQDQSGFWWVRLKYFQWAPYGAVTALILNFKSSSASTVPTGLSYSYHSLTKYDPQSHLTTLNNSGAGSVSVTVAA